MTLDPTQTVISKLFVHENKLYVGLADYRVSIVDLDSFDIIAEITQELWEVKAVYVSPQNIYVGSLNEKLLIYDHNYNLIKKINHKLGVISIEVDRDYIYTGSYDGQVKIWNKLNFEFVASLKNHLIRVNDIVTDNNFIYTGDGFSTAGAQIRKWNKSDFNFIYEFSLPSTKRVNCMIIDSTTLYVGHGGSGEIRIINLHSKELIKNIETKSDVKSLAINDDYIVIAMKDKIKIFDKFNFEVLKEISENGREVNDCTFYGPYIIYSSRDRIKIIDSKTFELSKEISFQTRLIPLK